MAVNYLLGYGERLMDKVDPPGRDDSEGKKHPYGFDDAKRRFLDRMPSVARTLSALPRGACPRDEAVTLVTVHPTYLAKSYFPTRLFRETKLRSVGSRERRMVPEIPSPTAVGGMTELATEIFVAGERRLLSELHETIGGWSAESYAAEDLRKVEDVRAPVPKNKIRVTEYDTARTAWEAVLHADASRAGGEVIESFSEFVSECGGAVDLDRRLYAGGLCFVPVMGEVDVIERVAPFAFLRVIRSMPRLRPITRTVGSPLTFDCQLPDVPAMDSAVRTAVLDGGPVHVDGLERWVNNIEADGVGAGTVDDFRDHSIGVASAFLFGAIQHDSPLPQPYANVDVVRVLDDTSEGPNYFDVLGRVVDTLNSRDYEFVNLSIGPDWPVEDDEPHAWTAVLDQCFGDRRIMPFNAVGNNGDRDWESGNARVQPPSDCVNGFAIGSCTSQTGDWRRSQHSSIGPGRRPGFVRPEAVAFGGCPENPFFVIGPAHGTAIPVQGTSFAGPVAMRTAAGVRAYLGPVMSPLAIKALIINRIEARGDNSMREVGWGRICHSAEELLTSDDSTAHIVYQRELSPGSWMRTPIPVPDGELNGDVYITATLCYKTDTDPEHPINYTRAGLEIVFRPNASARKNEAQRNPDSKTFFSQKKMYGEYATEAQLRSDAHKWETVVHCSGRLRSKSVYDPCFDIHYNARERGADTSSAAPIQFALVVTVHSKGDNDLYNKIARRYRTVLEALTPVRVPAAKMPG